MKSSLRRRAPRGSAAAELSILMVALVPLIMYTLFLQDLLTYKLESQEPTVTAPWDYTVYNYATPIKDQGKEDINFTVQRSNRRTFCDHNVAYNTYGDVAYDCMGNEAVKHHQGATVAHQCWITGDAHQVTCEIKGAIGKAQVGSSTGGGDWYDAFNKGGVAQCNARLGVMNAFLPHRIFTWSAHKDDENLAVSTKKNYEKTTALNDVHKADSDTASGDIEKVDGPGAKDQYVMRTEYFGVLHDPWALNAGEFTSDPEKSTGQKGDGMEELVPSKIAKDHPLYTRASKYYDSSYGSMATMKAWNFGRGMSTFVSLAAVSDEFGDDPQTMPMLWKKAAERDIKNSNRHFASGWVDSRVESTHGARTQQYFSKGANEW